MSRSRSICTLLSSSKLCAMLRSSNRAPPTTSVVDGRCLARPEVEVPRRHRICARAEVQLPSRAKPEVELPPPSHTRLCEGRAPSTTNRRRLRTRAEVELPPRAWPEVELPLPPTAATYALVRRSSSLRQCHLCAWPKAVLPPPPPTHLERGWGSTIARERKCQERR